MTSRKILIVDDDADLSEALIDQLSLYDEFELPQAATAARASRRRATAMSTSSSWMSACPTWTGARR